MSIEVLYADVGQARQSWQELVSLLGMGNLEFDRNRTVLGDRSLSAFARQVDLGFELLLSVEPDDEMSPAVSVLFAQEGNLRPQLQAFHSHAVAAVVTCPL